jgi:hypothetical protein
MENVGIEVPQLIYKQKRDRLLNLAKRIVNCEGQLPAEFWCPACNERLQTIRQLLIIYTARTLHDRLQKAMRNND